MEPKRTGPLSIGDTFLDKYEVRRVLGSGGHAFVYECFDVFLSRVVAIKVIKSGVDSAANVQGRARTEAQLLVRIDHPQLVKVIDAGVWRGLVYLVMEYLDGRNLREVLRELGRLSVAEALIVGMQIADGMAYAHGKRVIHRDLKPENIFILAENVAKVLDFGIAKVRGLDGLDPKTTQPDIVQGTWLYMSPEHLQGHPVTERSDIFAVGTMLFEALYTHPLRVGEEPVGRDQAAWMQMFKVPPLLSDLDPSIPRYVAKAIHRALLKVPGERYASMGELKDALLYALKRHLDEDSARGLVVTRPLYRPQSVAEEAAPPQTVRAHPVLTNQVTVKAPHVQSGETEPLPRFSPEPSTAAVKDQMGGPRSPGPAKPSSTPPRSGPPPSSEKPTIWVQPSATGASPPVAPGAKTSRRDPTAVTPSTAPPVTTRAPIGPPRLAVDSWLQDRALKLAAIAAVLAGVVGGTAYGVLATRSGESTPTAPTASAQAAAGPSARVQEAPAVAPLPDKSVEAATAPPSGAPSPSLVVAQPSPPRPASPPQSKPTAVSGTALKHAAPKPEQLPDSGLPTVEEVQRRFEEHDRKAQAKPAPTAAKPTAAPTPAAPKRRETVF